MKNINPVGLIGTFTPEDGTEAWEKYIGKYCQIEEATFSSSGGELLVRFGDFVKLTIQAEEFTVL